MRTRIDKWDCIKLRSFCTSKETINRMKIVYEMRGDIYHQIKDQYPEYTKSSKN
jgi:hypothetical protein